jgi:putative restriction endonuclease
VAKNWDHAAGIVWSLLTKSAAKHRILSYADVAPAISTNPLSVRLALAPIQDHCLENGLPPLTSIVVSQSTSLPGEGFIAWDVDDLASAHATVFAFDWSPILNPYAAFGPKDTVESLAAQIVKDPNKAKTIYAKVKVRDVAQRIFRALLLKTYGRCAMCGLTFLEALEAAYIISWASSTPAQRLDPKNGVLLCATHHKLFDAALITVSKSLTIVYCDPKMQDDYYSELDCIMSSKLHGATINLPKHKSHWPCVEWLALRHSEQGWGTLP